MRTLLLGFLAIAFSLPFPQTGCDMSNVCPASGGAAFAVTQTYADTALTGGSETFNFGTAVPAGQNIHLSVQSESASSCLITSTPSNTWVAGPVSTIVSGGGVQMWVAFSVAASTNAIVVDCPGGNAVGAFAFTGGSAIDQTGTTAAGTNVAPSIATTGSVTSSTELVVASCADWAQYNGWVAGTGYNIPAASTALKFYTNGTLFTSAAEINNTFTGLSGVQTATFTASSATDAKACAIMTIK